MHKIRHYLVLQCILVHTWNNKTLNVHTCKILLLYVHSCKHLFCWCAFWCTLKWYMHVIIVLLCTSVLSWSLRYSGGCWRQRLPGCWSCGHPSWYPCVSSQAPQSCSFCTGPWSDSCFQRAQWSVAFPCKMQTENILAVHGILHCLHKVVIVRNVPLRIGHEVNAAQ